MRRIPQAFHLMGHRITVKVISNAEWKYDDAMGIWEPSKNQISLRRQPRSMLRHTFWHEVTHAMLDVISHKLSGNEQFVDSIGGMLAQINDTAEY